MGCPERDDQRQKNEEGEGRGMGQDEEEQKNEEPPLGAGGEEEQQREASGLRRGSYRPGDKGNTKGESGGKKGNDQRRRPQARREDREDRNGAAAEPRGSTRHEAAYMPRPRQPSSAPQNTRPNSLGGRF